MNAIDAFLFEIRADPRFTALVEKLRTARPHIPVYPSTTEEEWKFKSGERRGFDLALSFFNLDFDGDENGRPQRSGE